MCLHVWPRGFCLKIYSYFCLVYQRAWLDGIHEVDLEKGDCGGGGGSGGGGEDTMSMQM